MSEENWLRFNKKIKYVVLDCETFNLALNWQINRCWEVAYLKVEGENILQEIDLFIKWPDFQFKIGEGAARVTRFDQQDFDRKAIDYETAFAKLWPDLEWADKIIIHNGLQFDMYLLRGYAEQMGKDWKFILDKIIDTKSVAQGVKLECPYKPQEDILIDYQYRMAANRTKGVKTNLTTLGKEYGIDFDYDSLHNGLQDVKLLLKVWNKLKYQIEI